MQNKICEMFYTLLDAFSISQYITNPISLIAFFIAALMAYFIARNINDRKKIESVSEKDRAGLIIKTAEKLNLDIKLVPVNERSALIKKVLANRIKSQLIVATVIILIGLMITYFVTSKKITLQLTAMYPISIPRVSIKKLLLTV